MIWIVRMLLICITAVSCSESKQDKIEFKIINDEFKVSEFNISKLDNKKYNLKSEGISGIFTNMVVKDSLLVCGNLYSSKLLNIYSLNSKKLLKQFVNRGTLANEGLSASNFYSQNKTGSSYIWMYDITLGKLFKTDLLSNFNDTIFVPKKEISLGGVLKNIIAPQIINDNLILSTSYALDDCRYFYSDGSKILKKIGKLPNISNEEKLANISKVKIPNKANIFKAFSVKKPNENRIAIFYNKADRVEFYVNDKLNKIWNSKEKFNPVMQVKKMNIGYIVQDDEETRYAYLSVTSDEKYIYALYAGIENYKTSSDIILVFDWSGNVVKKISLDKKVCKITLEPLKSILFCYDYENQIILSTKL